MLDNELLDLAREYADAHPNFDCAFIDSLQDFYDRKGHLTGGQSSALMNIVERFRMEKWRDSQ